MAFFVQLGQDPYKQQAGQLGQSFAQGLGVHFKKGEMQQQQGQLANALFGDKAQQFDQIPLEQQLKIAEFQQTQQKNANTLQQQKNVAQQLFPEQADLFSQLPVQQQVEVANLFSKNKDKEFRQNVINKLFGGQQGGEPQLQPKSPLQPGQIQQSTQFPGQQQQGYNPAKYSDAEIAAIGIVDKDLARLMQSQKEASEKKTAAMTKEERDRFESDRDYHSKVSRPIIEQANQTIQNYDIEQGLNEQQRKDIASGNIEGFYPYLVNNLGLTSFSNPELARFGTEIKKKFVSSLSDIPGARPNQFIERFLSTAQPQVGQSAEANLSVMDLDDFVRDVKHEQAVKELEIAKEDRDKLGYVREDVSERARQKLGDYVNRRQEKMALDIQNRHEENLKDVDLLNEIVGKSMIPGTYVTPRTMKLLYIKNGKNIEKTVDEAKSLGMRFPEYATQ